MSPSRHQASGVPPDSTGLDSGFRRNDGGEPLTPTLSHSGERGPEPAGDTGLRVQPNQALAGGVAVQAVEDGDAADAADNRRERQD